MNLKKTVWLIIFIISILLLSGCVSSKYSKSYREKRNLMILEDVRQPKNKKFFEQNHKKRYKKNKRRKR